MNFPRIHPPKNQAIDSVTFGAKIEAAEVVL
jgi:hypothetical protein